MPIKIMNREIHEIYDRIPIGIKQSRQSQAAKPPLKVTEGEHRCSICAFSEFGMCEFPFVIWVNG